MAHHLAELVIRAKEATDPAQQAVANDQVVETILRIWNHRSTVDRINPLTELAPPLRVLRTLAEVTPPWGYMSRGGLGATADRTYDLLRRLTICLSLLATGDIEATLRGLERAGRTSAWQSEEELELVRRLSLWVELDSLEGKERRESTRRTLKSTNQRVPPLDLTEAACRIVDEVEVVLADLRKTLQKGAS